MNFKDYVKEQLTEQLSESWSAGISSNRNIPALNRKSKEHSAKSNSLHKQAASHKEGTKEYHKLKADAHTEYAKHIKVSYHNDQWGSQEQAKKDHKKEMALAKEHKEKMLKLT